VPEEPRVDGVTEEELAAQDGETLPPREVMSVIDCTFERPVPLEDVPTGGDSGYDPRVA